MAGDTIDEAIALTVAGNQVLQDPLTVGQSLKTIALRLQGTSLKQMQEMGEYTDGVTTQSKLRNTLMNATRVASNQYRGIDILDSNGNYRSTFSVLKDIADIYQEIKEEDKFTKNNRAALITEAVAGKTRAAAAASILESPQILQSVYESSLESQGSAQKELDKYLDSVNGHMQRLQNSLQKISQITFDSEWLKVLIDLGKIAVDTFGGVIEKFGGLKTIIAGISAINLTKNGLVFDKSLLNLFKPQTAHYDDNVIQLDSYIRSQLQNNKYEDIDWASKMQQLGINNKGLEETLKTQQGYESLSASIRNAGNSFSFLSRAGTVASKVTKTLLSGLANVAIIYAAITAITLLGKGIYNLVMADEIAIEKGKEAREEIQKITKDLEDTKDSLKKLGEDFKIEIDEKDMKKSLKSIADEYSKLSQGVNSSTNENLTLSSDDYQKYLDISNKLAEIYPSLKKGTDAQGNAMLNLSKNSEECAKNLQTVYNNALLASNVKIAENMQTAFVGLSKEFEQYQEELDKLTTKEEEVTDFITKSKELISNPFEGMEISGDYISFDYAMTPEQQKRLRHSLMDTFDLLAYNFDVFSTRADGIPNMTKVFIEGLSEKMENDTSLADFLSDYVQAFVTESSDQLQSEKIEIDTEMTINEDYKKDLQSNLNSVVSSFLATSSSFGAISGSLQNAIISGLDVNIDDIQNNYDGSLKKYIYGAIINPITKLEPDVQEQLAKIISIDYKSTKVPFKETIKRIKEDIENIPELKDSGIDWIQYLNVDDLEKEYDEMHDGVIRRISKLLGGVTSEQNEFINSLDYSDMSKLSEIVFSDKSIKSWETIMRMFNSTSIKKKGTFADLINTDNFKNKTEEIEKGLSAINSAITSFRENGRLDSAMKDLLSSVPGIDVESIDNLKKLEEEGGKYLGKFISFIYEEGKMAELSADEFEKLNKYAYSYIETYKDFDVSEDTIVKNIRENLIKGWTNSGKLDASNHYLVDRINSATREFLEEFDEEMQDENKRAILYALIASDDITETSVEELREKFDTIEVNFELSDKFTLVDDLEKELAYTKLQAQDTLREINKYVENGNYGSSQQYEGYEELVRNNANQYDILENTLAPLNDIKDVLESTFTAEQLSKMPIYETIINKINEAKIAQDELNKTTLEYNLMLNGGIELGNLTNTRNALIRANTALTDEMSLRQSRGLTGTVDLYDKLSSNTIDQISNLQEQNKMLEQQQHTVGITNTKYNELFDTISSNNSTINTLTQNLDEYNTSMLNYMRNYATSLKNAVDSAISESSSETGLTGETIKTLKAQFSELEESADFDLSALFYESAEGVKLNTNVLDGLVQVQKKAYAKTMLTNISKQNKLLSEQLEKINQNKSATKKADTEALKGHREKLNAMYEELAGYESLISAIEQQNSGYNKWQNSKSTANDRDIYETIATGILETEDALNQGKLTDEVADFISMATRNGGSSESDFLGIEDTLLRYFNEKSTEGLNNFLADLVANGFATLEDGMYSFENLDISEVGERFNISDELVKYLLQALNEMEGFNVDIVNGPEDALLQSLEAQQQLMDEYANLAKATDESTRQKSLDNIAELESRINWLSTFQESSEMTDEEFNSARQEIQMLIDQLITLDSALDPSVVLDRIATLSKQYGLELTEDGMGIITQTKEEAMQNLANISLDVPDLSKVLDTDNPEAYETSYQKLMRLMSAEGVNFNLLSNLDTASTEDIKTFISSLENTEITLDPETYETFKTVKDMASNELKVRTLLEYTTNNNQAKDITELASLSDDELRTLIIDTKLADTDEDTSALIELIRNKAGEVAIKTTMDESDKEFFESQFGRIETKLGVSEESKAEVEQTIEEMEPEVEAKVTVDNTGITSEDLAESMETGVFGNIDLNNRQAITWTKELKEQYGELAKEFEEGSISTVLGSWQDFADKNLSIAFSPMLQTENGAVLLDDETVHNYLNDVIKEATDQTTGEVDFNKILEIDAQGFNDVVDQYGNVIKGLIAGVANGVEEGNNADLMSRLMHDFEELKYADYEIPEIEVDAKANTEEIHDDIKEDIESVAEEVEDTIKIEPTVSEDLDVTSEMPESEVEINAVANPEKLDKSLKDVLDNNQYQVSLQATLQPTNEPKSLFKDVTNNLSSHAQGTGELAHNETALVNEVGEEGLIRNGKLAKIPGGMHIQNFKKGDVILSTSQMEQLKKFGKATGKGKIVGGKKALNAHAQGTLQEGEELEAHVLGTLLDDELDAHVMGTLSAYADSSTNSNAKATKTTSKGSGKATSVDPEKTLNNKAYDKVNKTVNTVFDRIPRYLDTLADIVSDLDASINEYTESTKKRELTQDKATAIMEQISAYGTASVKYLEKANQIANSAQYTDRYGNVHNLNKSLSEKYNLQDLITGKLTLEEIGSDTDSQLYYDVAQQFLEYYDKAQDSISATNSLTDTLTDTYEALINIPFDELSRELNKISNQLSLNSSFSNIASKGESASAVLSRTIAQYYGADSELASMFDSSGKSYEVLNRQLEKNIELREKEVIASRDAVAEAKQTYAELSEEYNSLLQDFSKIKETIISSIALSDEDLAKIQKGRKLNASDLLEYGEENTGLLTTYNNLLEETEAMNEALEKSSDTIDDQTYEGYEKLAELAQSIVDKTSEAMNNIKDYYSSISSYLTTLNAGLKSNNEYIIKWLGYVGNSSQIVQNYNDEIANYNQQMTLLTEEIAVLETKLNEAIANGDIIVGTKDYYDLLTPIEELKNDLNDIPNSVNEAFDSMMNVPNEEVTEKLDDIATAFDRVTQAISNNTAQSLSYINMYNKKYGYLSGDLFNTSGTPMEYSYANALLDSELEQANQEAEAAIQGYYQAKANYEYYSVNGTAEQAKSAKEAFETATKTLNEKTFASAAKEVSIIEEKMGNISNYYDTHNSKLDSELTLLKNRASYAIEYKDIEAGSTEAISAYYEIASKTQEKVANLNAEADALEQTLLEGIWSGQIQVGDLTWTKLTTDIQNTRNEAEETEQSLASLYEEMMEIPDKQLERALNRIANAFAGVTAIADNSLTTLTGRTMLKASNEALTERFGDIGQVTLGLDPESYKYENEIYDQQLKQEEENLEQYETNLEEKRAIYENLKNSDQASTEELIKAKEDLDDTETKVIQQNAKVTALRAQRSTAFMENIAQYYDKQIEYTDSIIDNLNAQLTRNQNRGNYANANIYEQQRDLYLSEADDLKEERTKLEKDMAEQLANGMVEGSEEHKEYIKKINNVNTNLENIYDKVDEINKNTLNLPTEIADKQIERNNIKNGERKAEIDADIHSSNSLYRLYMMSRGKAVEDEMAPEYWYQDLYQNRREEKQAKEELEIRKKATRTAARNYNPLDQDSVDAYNTARNNEAQAAINYSKVVFENIQKNMQNIGTYFKTFVDYIDSMNSKLEVTKSITEELSTWVGSPFEIGTQTADIMANQAELFRYSAMDYKKEKAVFDKAVAKGDIPKGGTDWRNRMTDLNNLQVQTDNYMLNVIQSMKEIFSIPQQYGQNMIDKEEENFKLISDAMSQGITDSESMMAMYTRLVQQFNGNVNMPYETGLYKSLSTQGPLYAVQNATIADQVLKETENTNAKYQQYYLAKYLADTIGKNAKTPPAIKAMLADMEEQSALELNEQLTTLTSARATGAIKMVENINNYYSEISDTIDAIAQRSATLRQYLTEFNKYAQKSTEIVKTYTDEFSTYNEEIAYLEHNASEMRKQLNKAVEQGDITKGSTEYKKVEAMIMGVEDKITATKTKQLELFRDMVDIPSKVVEERIQDISDAYNSLNVAMSNNLTATSLSQRLWKNYNDAMNSLSPNYNPDNVGVHYYGEDTPSYFGQNRALMDNVQQLRQQAEQYGLAVVESQKLLDATLANKDASQEEINVVKDGYKKAVQQAQNSIAELAKAQAELFTSMISNIENYFQRVNSFYSSVVSKISATRTYMTEIFGYQDSQTMLGVNFNDNISLLDSQLNTTVAEIKAMQNQLDEALAQGMKKTDDEYIDAMTKINSLNAEAINTAKAMFDIYKEQYNLTNNIASERIQDLEKEYQNLTVALNNIDTRGKQNIYARLAEQFGATNPYVNVAQSQFNVGRTYQGQNEASRLNLEKSMAELRIFSDALLEAGQHLDELKIKGSTEEEYKAAMLAMETATTNFANKQGEVASQMAQFNQSLSNISTYYNSYINYFDALANRAGKVREVMTELGRTMDNQGNLITDTTKLTKSYTDQIDALNKKQENQMRSIVAQEHLMNDIEYIYGEDSEEYRQAQVELMGLKDAYDDTTIAVDRLQDEMRNELYIKPIEEAIAKLDKLKTAFSSINGLILDESKITEEGEFTDLGRLSLALDVSTYRDNIKILQGYEEEYRTIQKRFIEDDTFSAEERDQAMADLQSKFQSSAGDILSSSQAIINALKNRYQTEINYIKKLINAYSEELSKKKEISDYDKNLRKKNEAVRDIQAQIRALERLILLGILY